MSGTGNVRTGMEVYGSDNRLIGTVEDLLGDGIRVDGRAIPAEMVARVTKGRVYLRTTAERLGPARAGAVSASSAVPAARVVGTTTGAASVATSRASASTTEVPDHLVVDVAEERLSVGKQEVELGVVEIRKEVVQEEQAVPVELMREEVHVRGRDIADRPIGVAEAEALFTEDTIRVSVMGEQAVVTKEAVLTGEVVVDKERLVERQEIVDTVRKERVEVDEHYERARGDFREHFVQRQGTAGTDRTFEQAEPNYRSGFAYGGDARYAGRTFEEVEPELRGAHEGSGGDSAWEHLRDEVREGFNRARGR